MYVKNVDYGADPKELKEHFHQCGTINRVTVICDQFTGHPLGYAYIEFSDAEGANNAKHLNESLFRGRQIAVVSKRKNIPGKGRGRFRHPTPGRGYYMKNFKMYPPYGGGRHYRYRPY